MRRSTASLNTWLRTIRIAAAAAVVALPASLSGQVNAPESDAEARARLQRRGAGLRIGIWSVRGLQEVAGAETSTLPLIEGYFERGLDRHLAFQSSVGVWRRTQEIESGGLGGTGSERVASWVVPMFTALRFFPATGPEHAFEPYVEGGVGFALGLDDRQTEDGGPLGLGTASGIAMIAGFGLKGGLGFEWRFSRALGLVGGGRYQWIRFLEDVGGDRIFRGFGAEAGLTYRFQFD